MITLEWPRDQERHLYNAFRRLSCDRNIKISYRPEGKMIYIDMGTGPKMKTFCCHRDYISTKLSASKSYTLEQNCAFVLFLALEPVIKEEIRQSINIDDKPAFP